MTSRRSTLVELATNAFIADHVALYGENMCCPLSPPHCGRSRSELKNGSPEKSSVESKSMAGCVYQGTGVPSRPTGLRQKDDLR